MFNHVYDNPSQAALHYYLAGIVDGEGCIRIDYCKSNGLYKPVLQVGMVEEHIIRLVESEFGGSVRKERVPNKRSIWRVKVQSVADWGKVIPALDGKLLVKQRQLDLVKEYISERIPHPNHKRLLCEEELQRRQGLYLKSKELNAVGAGATTERVEYREVQATV